MNLLKRFGSLALSALLAVSVLAGAANAQETGGEAREINAGTTEEGGFSYYVDEETLGGMRTSTEQLFGAARTAPDEGGFYAQLTESQKKFFDVLEEMTVSRITASTDREGDYAFLDVSVPGYTGTRLTGYYRYGKFLPDTVSNKVVTQLYTDMLAAVVAFRYDRPDSFWTASVQYGYNWKTVNNTTVELTDMTFGFELRYGGRETAMWNDMMAAASKMTASIDTTADRYTQVKQVHDALAALNTYGDVNGDLSHTAYSGLIGGDAYEPVCDGYAKSVKVLCDKLGIPNMLAMSETHMWNNIKMDDGDWYNLDVTWDDADDEQISYDYFLIGSGTVVDGEAFSEQADHVEENPYPKKSGHLDVTLSYPPKNTVAYEYLGGAYPELAFPDVRRSQWYYEYVEEAAKLGLFSGDNEGNFLPDKAITRAEFATVIANSRHADLSGAAGSPFEDVAADAWYAAAVSWVKEQGLMQGSGNQFRPNAAITREEMCVVFRNLLKAEETGVGLFVDDASISSWARDSVYICREAGLIYGDNYGNFNPRSTTPRREAAAVFVRYTNAA